jgi:3-oxoacyl-[acyl-carrier-protein] synthase-3
MAIPDRVLTNAELAQMVDTTDEWIVSRTGIRERRIAEDDQTTASLATEAALNAISVANLSPMDIDLIIVATSSPEHLFPATACLVQNSIGATKAGAFDLLAACTGFIYALNMASQAIATGSAKTAVVIGSRSDGSGADLLSLPAGGSALPTSIDTVNEGLHFISMSGREVYRFATRVMTQATEEAVKKAGLKITDIDLVVPHQANQRIIETALKNLKIPLERCVINLDRYGNTSTASIPIAACEALQDGKIRPGDRLVFVGFGSGLTWGAAVVQWSGPFPTRIRMIPGIIRFYARVRSLLLRLLRFFDSFFWDRFYNND